MALRTRKGTLLAKVEPTAGTDAAPTTANAMLVENLRIVPDQSVVQTNELTGSLDPRAPIPTGLRVNVSFDVYIKGSGTAGTAPEFGDLFKACGWEEVTQTLVGPTSAASGTTTTITLPAAATGVAQAYRGMPINLSGNLAATIAAIADYTAGRVATLTSQFPTTTPSSTTLFSIPANTLYRPTSDLSLIPSLTFYGYMDGLLYKVFGARGTFSIALQAGQPGKISFNFTGIYGGKSDAAVPAINSFDTTRPPVWKDPDGFSGVMSINRAEAAVRTLGFENGNQLVYPDNPNALEGFDPTEIVSRQMAASLDPLATLIATRDLLADMQAGTQRIVHARYGTVAGNRFMMTMPAAQPVGVTPGDREGLMTEDVRLFPSGEDAGCFLCFY
jgi:hypothetical protein